jgi:hypothetical protein
MTSLLNIIEIQLVQYYRNPVGSKIISRWDTGREWWYKPHLHLWGKQDKYIWHCTKLQNYTQNGSLFVPKNLKISHNRHF